MSQSDVKNAPPETPTPNSTTPEGSATWSIRPASEDDVQKVSEIDHQIQPSFWTAQQFAEEMNKPYSRFLVVTDDETDELISGYLVFWIFLDEVQVHTIGVAPSFRGQGFAKRLLKQAIREGLQANCRQVSLEVRKGNLAAIQLYQGLGFTITQVRKGFYTDGEDAYQMCLSLIGKDPFQLD